jgi:hypothetical protein
VCPKPLKDNEDELTNYLAAAAEIAKEEEGNGNFLQAQELDELT